MSEAAKPAWQNGQATVERIDALIAECDALENELVKQAEGQIAALTDLLKMQQNMRGTHGNG